MKRISVIAILIAVAAALLGGGIWYGSKIIHKTSAHHEMHEKKIIYHCPMHPTYTSDKPGECPICGMNLVPMETGEMKMHKDMKSADEVPERAAVNVTDYQRQVIGLTTAKTEYKKLVRQIRTVGVVAYDPALATAQREFIEAKRVGDGTLMRAARERLKLMGMGDDQISKLASSKRVQKNLYSPSPDGKVWIYSTFYEMDIPLIKTGQEIEVSTSESPNRVFLGKIAAVDTVLDSKSRTLRARSEVADPDGLLKPERYVNVKLSVPLDETLAIPSSALIWSGEGNYAFVDTGNGRLEPRLVTAGVKAGDEIQILAGLKAGENVVTSANFLIDSESALKAAAQALGGKKAEGHMH